MLNSWRMMLSKAVCTRRMKCSFHSKHPKYELRNYNAGLRSTQNKNGHNLLTNSDNKAARGRNFSELMLWNLSGYLSGRKRNNNWDQCKKAPLCLKRRVSEDGLRTLFVHRTNRYPDIPCRYRNLLPSNFPVKCSILCFQIYSFTLKRENNKKSAEYTQN